MTSSDSEPELPASIRAAWGLAPRPGRGPRPGLTLERVVAAGIAVARAEGLAAVSMARVARELGSSPMSLYRYVAAKDELLALMVDAAMGQPPALDLGHGWRPALEQWATAALRAYLDQLWVVRVPIPGPPITPNQIRWMEAGLSCLRGTGLGAQEKLSTILLVSNLARVQAVIVADVADVIAAGGTDPGIGYVRALTQVADAETFPEVNAVVRSGVLDDEDQDFATSELRFGLARVLDGLELLVRERSAPSR